MPSEGTDTTSQGASSQVAAQHQAAATHIPPGYVPKDRLDEVIAERNAARAELATHAAKAAEATALQARLVQVEARAAQERALLEMAREHPAFWQPSVRSRAMTEYQQAHAEVPAASRPAFDAWARTLKDDPFWAPHFAVAQQAAQGTAQGQQSTGTGQAQGATGQQADTGASQAGQGGAVGQTRQAVDVNRGAASSVAAASSSEQQIREAYSRGSYGAFREADMAAAIAAGEILPPKKKTT